MTKHTLKTTRTSLWNIDDKDNDSWIVAKTGKIVIGLTSPEPEKTGINVTTSATGNDIIVNGSIKLANLDIATDMETRGIKVAASDTSVAIGKSGRVTSGYGIEATSDATNFSAVNLGRIQGFSGMVINGAADATVSNAGKILATDSAIWSLSDGATAANSGFLFGYFGFRVSGENTHVVNGKTGIIQAAEGISFDSANQSSNSGINRGLIDATSYSLIDGLGNLTFKNTGKMNGEISLGAGDDIFNTSKGIFNGSLYGGQGNDVFILKSTKTTVLENAGQGDDTIKIAVNYTLGDNIENLSLLGDKNRIATGNELANTLTGNKANNTLYGQLGNDSLNGRGGNDLLAGGMGFDVFVFEKGGDKDRVTDFVDGEDLIEISGFAGITKFDELQNHISEAANGDVIINFGDGDVLKLTGVALNMIDMNDFNFA